MPLGDVTPKFGSPATSGTMIALAATSTPGTTLHVATSDADKVDFINVWLCNIHTADVEVTLEMGGTTASDQCIQTIPSKSGMVKVVDNFRASGGATIRAFAGTTNVINAQVSVDTYTVA